jgi:catechol 2,3-dioxygenase-like lactoylglutathione lyase family enzyme
MARDFNAEVAFDANHTAIKVRDLKSALRFYSELIGLPVLRFRGPEDNPSAVWLPGLQLVVDPNTSSGGSLDHVALGIINIEDACKRLDDAGFVADTPLQQRTPEDVGRNLKMAFYHDPEGNKVELLHYLD